jgi:hypothetical protein
MIREKEQANHQDIKRIDQGTTPLVIKKFAQTVEQHHFKRAAPDLRRAKKQEAESEKP